MMKNEVTQAKVHGEHYVNLPLDLYIPPDALQIFLEAFEGPLDLLLYLIKKQNFNILDIPIADITRQYMQYIDIMKELHIELAAEYLLMAAMLAEIKSRLLLPKLPDADLGEESDPRAELVRRLQEYEQYQQAAIDLDQLPRIDREFYAADVEVTTNPIEVVRPQISLQEMMQALQAVLERAKLYSQHQVLPEVLSIRERMTFILSHLQNKQFVEFTGFFQAKEGKMGVVVTLIAVLELIRQSTLELVQNHPFAPIYVKLKIEETI